MTYTINGKEYTEFDINKRCSELMGIDAHVVEWAFGWAILHSRKSIMVHYEPCGNPTDTDAIIDKCWDELMVVYVTDDYYARWECIVEEYNCTKLIAACICLIESKEGA
jgi:hypothetical protein